jgi:hypothetical protein
MYIGREAETALIIIMTTSVTIAAAVLADRRARRRAAAVMSHLPLDRSGYWGVYSDVLADLGGIDGEQPRETPPDR